MDPFAPRSWDDVGEDGTFGNRFDDPGALRNIGTARRFRTIYCATERVAAFAEVVARMRPSIRLLDQLAEVDDEDEPLDDVFAGVVDPEFPAHGLITHDWRLRRRVGKIALDPALRFVDLDDPENIDLLRRELAPLLRVRKMDLDLSTLVSGDRALTQAIARFVYEQQADDGHPMFAGIRYVSRLSASWECWAVFDSGLHGDKGLPETVHPDDPGLLEAARVFQLTIEGPTRGHYLRPWQG
ncbi:MAG TPA: RES family NAD+ phosphorylase [Thermomicrobiaceae bacterium]|nr:RES family NAD+ phosphorylase [Thermomicrobiaceae bacterium]